MCFNPRPPLLAGDAAKPAASSGNFSVSIRARHCWRAMPPVGIGNQHLRLAVSIRARHCWRAMRVAPALVKIVSMFQSAPAIAGGRCSMSLLDRSSSDRFQSAPAIAGGRCAPGRGRRRAPGSFNPRPPLLAGDASFFAPHVSTRAVSIRARHCWRAMPAAPACAWCPCARFNPRPPLLAGDALISTRMTSPKRCFNPRPPLLAGDANPLRILCAREIQFQSAPAIAGGRCPASSRNLRRSRDVSILARHCWRAMPQRQLGIPPSMEFQSAPAIAGGRCNLLAVDAQGNYKFQSAPAIAGGRCMSAASLAIGPSCFNPRPPLLAGDAPSSSRRRRSGG